MVVPEALSFSLPILCFDNDGPGELMDNTCGFKVPYSNPEESIQAFSKYLNLLFHSEEKRSELSKGAKIYFEKQLTWERKGKLISEVYREILNQNMVCKKKCHHSPLTTEGELHPQNFSTRGSIT